MAGNRGSGFDTRWLLANFLFSLSREKFVYSCKKMFTVVKKCHENGIDRLRKGNA